MNQRIILIVSSFLVPFLFPKSAPQINFKKAETEWLLSDLATQSPEKIRISGHPEMIKCKYGNALLFNGISDGIFLECMPIADMEQFTIEAIVRPDSGGSAEQRFFRCGEIHGDRVLMETRTTQTSWYFDAFIKSENQHKTLVDSTLLHPLNQWYHIAFVVDIGKLVTYVNGAKELEHQMNLAPFRDGKTSIGVRLNGLSWFKGAIYKIKISPGAMKPLNFMNY